MYRVNSCSGDVIKDEFKCHPDHKAMEQYERAIKNLKTARSEHVAAAQLIITAGML